MNKLITVLFFICATSFFHSCDKETEKEFNALSGIESTRYFDTEIYSQNDLKFYGKWQLFNISGGIHGKGYNLNFDYLEIKEIGIYGFVRNDTLLEYGKLMPALQTAMEIGFKVNFEKDSNSKLFFGDNEKYVIYIGDDTLNLNSPCCDRFNYHFKRIK